MSFLELIYLSLLEIVVCCFFVFVVYLNFACKKLILNYVFIIMWALNLNGFFMSINSVIEANSDLLRCNTCNRDVKTLSPDPVNKMIKKCQGCWRRAKDEYFETLGLNCRSCINTTSCRWYAVSEITRKATCYSCYEETRKAKQVAEKFVCSVCKTSESCRWREIKEKKDTKCDKCYKEALARLHNSCNICKRTESHQWYKDPDDLTSVRCDTCYIKLLTARKTDEGAKCGICEKEDEAWNWTRDSEDGILKCGSCYKIALKKRKERAFEEGMDLLIESLENESVPKKSARPLEAEISNDLGVSFAGIGHITYPDLASIT